MKIKAPLSSLLRRLFLFGASAALGWLTGCTTSQPERSADRLSSALCSLDHAVSPGEAALVAQTAHACSRALAQQYRVVRPMLLHNTLVNVGLRDRGLCFHWADDLSARLQTLELQTIDIHRGVARWQTRREHSAVILTARGQAFERGLVLDAWRDAGRLYWCAVREDAYPWIRVEVVPEDPLLTSQPKSVGR